MITFVLDPMVNLGWTSHKLGVVPWRREVGRNVHAKNAHETTRCLAKLCKISNFSGIAPDDVI